MNILVECFFITKSKGWVAEKNRNCIKIKSLLQCTTLQCTTQKCTTIPSYNVAKGFQCLDVQRFDNVLRFEI